MSKLRKGFFSGVLTVEDLAAMKCLEEDLTAMKCLEEDLATKNAWKKNRQQ